MPWFVRRMKKSILVIVLFLVVFKSYAELSLKSKLPGEADIYSLLEQEDESVTIVGTVDGMIHGLDAKQNKEKWSLSTGGSLIKSHQVSYFT